MQNEMVWAAMDPFVTYLIFNNFPLTEKNICVKIKMNIYNIKEAKMMENRTSTQNIVFDAFPKKVLEQSKAATKLKPSSQLARRYDLRGRTVLTFGETAQSTAETAISLYKDAGGWHLGLHIADVAEYVCVGSPLDIEAVRRNAAINNGYLKSDMLPDDITKDICNLVSGSDRLCVSVLLDIDNDGNLNSIKIDESVIRVAEKCIFNEIDQIGFVNEASSIMALREKYRPYTAILADMYELAAIFCNRRRNNGALDCSVYRKIYNRDENGKIVSFRFETEPDSRAMVREIGYFAAEAIGNYMFQKKMPCIYIGQSGLPNDELDYLENLLKIESAGGSNDKRTVEIAEIAKGSEYYEFVCDLMRNRLPRATYSDQPVFNLHCASDKVVSFVRPATRYTDILTQRAMKLFIAASGDPKNLNINRVRQQIAESVESANTAEGFIHKALNNFYKMAAAEYIESSGDTIYYGFPLKKEENGNILIVLLCGAFAYLPAEYVNDSLETGKLLAFEIISAGNEETPCIVKPANEA